MALAREAGHPVRSPRPARELAASSADWWGVSEENTVWWERWQALAPEGIEIALDADGFYVAVARSF